MAENEAVNQDEGTEELTPEQFQAKFTEIQKQMAEKDRLLEEIKKAQSGSDKRVTELTEALKQKEADADNAKKSAEEQFAERVANLEKENAEAKRKALEAEQRSLAISLLNDKGLKPPTFLQRLVGANDEETEKAITDYIEAIEQTKKSVAEEFAKKHGRTIVDGGKPRAGTLDDYSDEELKRLTDEEFQKVMDRSK